MPVEINIVGATFVDAIHFIKSTNPEPGTHVPFQQDSTTLSWAQVIISTGRLKSPVLLATLDHSLL